MASLMQSLAAGILSSYSQKWQPSLFSALYAGTEVVLGPVALEKKSTLQDLGSRLFFISFSLRSSGLDTEAFQSWYSWSDHAMWGRFYCSVAAGVGGQEVRCPSSDRVPSTL